MQSFVNVPHPNQTWTYAQLIVVDGDRRLKPTHAAHDRLYFADSPRLQCAQVEIILRNGDAEQRHTAIVLPHDASAKRIPIKLIT